MLFLTPQHPYPPHKGTTLRNYNLIKGLAGRHEIDLLTMIESQAELTEPTPLNALCRRIDGALTPHRSLAMRARDTLLSPRPDMALRLWSPQFAALVQQWLADGGYDIVQVEGIEMARYMEFKIPLACRPGQANSKLQTVFDDHNCEYVLQQRTFETDVRHPRRWLGALYSFIQWQKLRRFEAHACRTASRVIAVSEADAQALRRLVPNVQVAAIPNGIDLAVSGSLSFPLDLGEYGLVFTGTMDFRPNVDAALWFADQVLPQILAQQPNAHFYIVGQRPHPRLAALRNHPAITITGAVDDVRPYLAGAAVYVVPLRMGGGTRFKILEAAAQRCAMVSTRLGCEGFPVQAGRELALADTPAEFAAAVVALLGNPARRTQLGQAAYALAEAFDWQKIVPALEELYAR